MDRKNVNNLKMLLWLGALLAVTKLPFRAILYAGAALVCFPLFLCTAHSQHNVLTRKSDPPLFISVVTELHLAPFCSCFPCCLFVRLLSLSSSLITWCGKVTFYVSVLLYVKSFSHCVICATLFCVESFSCMPCAILSGTLSYMPCVTLYGEFLLHAVYCFRWEICLVFLVLF